MSKVRNKSVYSDDQEYLKRLADELDFIGRAYRLDLKKGVITQYALQPRKVKPKREERGKDKKERS